MNNRIGNIFILLMIATMFLSACGEMGSQGSTKITTKNGYDLHIVKDEPGNSPKEGEGLKLSLKIYADDSIVQELDSEMLGIQPMPSDSILKERKDPVFDALMNLSKGDSAVVTEKYEDLSDGIKQSVPNKFENLYYSIVLEDVLSVEELEAEVARLQAEREEQQRLDQQLIAERTVFLTEQQPMLNDIVTKYKNGKLDVRKLGAGLEVYMINDGNGSEINEGDEVEVDYIGRTLAAEKIFDSSFNRASGLPLMIGSGQVIPGWELALAELKRGDEAVIFIPSELAYRDQARGADIPANSDLVFYVKPQ